MAEVFWRAWEAREVEARSVKDGCGGATVAVGVATGARPEGRMGPVEVGGRRRGAGAGAEVEVGAEDDEVRSREKYSSRREWKACRSCAEFATVDHSEVMIGSVVEAGHGERERRGGACYPLDLVQGQRAPTTS